MDTDNKFSENPDNDIFAAERRRRGRVSPEAFHDAYDRVLDAREDWAISDRDREITNDRDRDLAGIPKHGDQVIVSDPAHPTVADHERELAELVAALDELIETLPDDDDTP